MATTVVRQSSEPLYRVVTSDADLGGTTRLTTWLLSMTGPQAYKLNPVTGVFELATKAEAESVAASRLAVLQQETPGTVAMADNGVDELVVTWVAVADEVYEVRFGDASGVYHTVATVTIADTSGTYTIIGLTTGVTRYAQVRRLGNGTTTLDSEWSAEVSDATD